MRILVVEDDPSVAQILKILLVTHGYVVEVAIDGEMGLRLAEAFEYDLILLDILLPKLDGITLCKRLRAEGHLMPILLLTGQGGSYEKVVGLDTGADDYVVKPFEPEELIARVRALLRRGHLSSQPILEWDHLRLDPGSRAVTYGNHSLALTPKEYGLIELLLRSPRRTFSLGTILEHLWTYEEAPSEDTVRVHIKTLRQKLKAAGAPLDLIETVYGVGYRLNPLYSSPKANSSASSPETTAETPPLLRAASDLAGSPTSLALPRILIIEPDPQTRSTLKELLERQGLQVTLLDSMQNLQHQDWQEMLVSYSPDLLLLAVEMPQKDGLIVCQLCRRHDRWQTLPIILLTPDADPDLVRQVFAIGADDFVSKPIVGPELLARVGVHLEKAQLQKKIAVLESQALPETLQFAALPKES